MFVFVLCSIMSQQPNFTSLMDSLTRTPGMLSKQASSISIDHDGSESPGKVAHRKITEFLQDLQPMNTSQEQNGNTPTPQPALNLHVEQQVSCSQRNSPEEPLTPGKSADAPQAYRRKSSMGPMEMSQGQRSVIFKKKDLPNGRPVRSRRTTTSVPNPNGQRIVPVDNPTATERDGEGERDGAGFRLSMGSIEAAALQAAALFSPASSTGDINTKPEA
jgi:hypothetical protein